MESTAPKSFVPPGLTSAPLDKRGNPTVPPTSPPADVLAALAAARTSAIEVAAAEKDLSVAEGAVRRGEEDEALARSIAERARAAEAAVAEAQATRAILNARRGQLARLMAQKRG